MPLSTADKFEIMELAARYNHAIDHRRAEEWADVFTEDGVLRDGNGVRAQGRAGFLALVQQRIEQGADMRHFTSSVVIEGEGDEARMRMYFEAYDVSDQHALGTPFVMGEYDDLVVKVDGRWKFKVRQIIFTAGNSARPR